jgi:hypothetical protein
VPLIGAYSQKCPEGVSLLKNSLGGRFHSRSGTKYPVFGLLEHDLWSLSAQRRLFQQAGVFSEVRNTKITHWSVALFLEGCDPSCTG